MIYSENRFPLFGIMHQLVDGQDSLRRLRPADGE